MKVAAESSSAAAKYSAGRRSDCRQSLALESGRESAVGPSPFSAPKAEILREPGQSTENG